MKDIVKMSSEQQYSKIQTNRCQALYSKLNEDWKAQNEVVKLQNNSSSNIHYHKSVK